MLKKAVDNIPSTNKKGGLKVKPLCVSASSYYIHLLTKVFLGPMIQAEALIVKCCGANISANVRYEPMSHNIEHLTYFL